MAVDLQEWETARDQVQRRIDSGSVELEINQVVIKFIKEKIKTMPKFKEENGQGKPIV